MTSGNLSKKPSIKWQDVPNDGSLDTFAKLNNLSIKALQLSEKEVIILPDNKRILDKAKDSNVFVQTSKEVLVALQEGGVQARLYDDGRESRVLILASADIILPTLLFLRDAIIKVVLAILAKLIYDWLKTDPKKIPSLKVEYLKLDLERNIVERRKLEGPADEVDRLLREESQTE